MGRKPGTQSGVKCGRHRGGNAGGRNVRRAIKLIEDALDAMDQAYYPARVLRHRALRILNGTGCEQEIELVVRMAIELVDDLSRAYRAMYSITQHDETRKGQLILTMEDVKPKTRGRATSRKAATPVYEDTGAAVTAVRP